MYVRTIKITFKDKMSKDMFVNYTDTKADAEGIKNESVDDFLDQLIKSMKNHLKQVQGVGVPLGTVPTFWTGYKIPDKGV